MLKKRYYLLLLLIALPTFVCHAETIQMRDSLKNEIRIGWGDQLFETLVWRERTTTPGDLVPGYHESLPTHFRYYQHLWAEYQYNVNFWFSVGGMVDMSGVSWQQDDMGHHFYNVVFMPAIRFTYYYHPNVSLYSGLGLGAVVNGGTEKNTQGKTIDGGAAVNFTLLGVKAGYGRWFGAFEWGGLYALRNQNRIFLASSRIMSVSVGVNF